ncbi:MAG: 50S ribosomal protein L24, partial [Oscillospiraceae bacterium]
MATKMHVRTDDHVMVLSGKDKGKKGKVLSVDPDRRMVIVEGVSVATKHKKPRKMGENGGIIKQETPIYACKVMNVCDKCNAATRV